MLRQVHKDTSVLNNGRALDPDCSQECAPKLALEAETETMPLELLKSKNMAGSTPCFAKKIKGIFQRATNVDKRIGV